MAGPRNRCRHLVGWLVVEDEFLIAIGLELLLQRHGWRVLERHGWRVLGPAATVAAALRLLTGERPDVAL